MRWTITLPFLALFIHANAVNVQITVQQQPVCSHATGVLYANASGGAAPYAYSWSNGSTGWMISNLPAGTYSVTVVDGNGEEATAEIDLEALTDWGTIGMGSHPLCDGQSPYGHFSASFFANLSDPYTTDLSAAFPLNIEAANTPFYNPMAQPAWLGLGYIVHEGPGWVSVNFTDATGCAGILQGEITGSPVEWPTFTSVEAAPSCGPVPNGSITVMRVGGSFASLHGPDGTTFWDTGFDQEEVFEGLAPGGHWLVQNTRTPATNSVNWEYLPAAQCGDSIYVVVPDAGPDCGELSGDLFIDANEDCVRQGDEIGAWHQILVLEPGPRYVSTGVDGRYMANVPVGTYSISAANEALLPTCPAQATVTSVSIPVQQDVAVLGTSGTMPDLWASISSGPARPGFQVGYSLHASNQNYGASGAVTATFTADPLTTIVSAQPTPTMISNGTVIWDLDDILPYQGVSFHVNAQVPADVSLIGTTLTAGFVVSSAVLDLDPLDNADSYTTVVTGSYDPNDKLAATSTQASEEFYFIDQDAWIDYTIRFQNTGNDTAFNVLVTDTLEATLDPATLRVGASSHPVDWDLGYGNVLRFHFDDILLPDSNVNEAASHGHVTFRIVPRTPLLPGSELNNTANIFFDFNPPIITPTSTLITEFSTVVEGTSPDRPFTIRPNPARDRIWIASKAGISSVRICAMDGRVVRSVPAWTDTLELDLEGLNAGQYLVGVVDGSGLLNWSNVIKQ